MKNLIPLLFILFTFCLNLSSQTPEQNLQKYWNYRERLRNEYIVVSPNDERGTNIPAVSKYFDKYWEVKDGITQKFTSWGDGNTNMSHYLGILATEYRLLKNNNQDYTQTIQELLYALKALVRLDGSVDADNIPYNGFFIRDDVDDAFYTANKTHFNMPVFRSCLTSLDQKEMSQDNVWNLLEGLALVKVLVDKEYVDGQWYDFKGWVQNITYRIITQMQHNVPLKIYFPTPTGGVGSINAFWYLKNPATRQLVKKGSGNEFDNEYIFSYGFAEAGNFIMDIQSNPLNPLHFQNSYSRGGYFNMALWEFTGSITIGVEFLGFTIYSKTIPYDDYSIRSLATTGGIGGTSTYQNLKYERDNNTIYGPYEHFPLIFLLLHAKNNSQLLYEWVNTYNSERAYYEYLLNQAPCDGPHSRRNSTYNKEWSSESRFVFPEYNGNIEDAEYAGLDYMLLHNLYYLLYRDHQPLCKTISGSLAGVGSVNNPYTIIGPTIFASNVISGNSYVHFKGCKIVLEHGFQVTGNSKFIAEYDPTISCEQFVRMQPQACPVTAGRFSRGNVNEVKTPDKSKSISINNPKTIVIHESNFTPLNTDSIINEKEIKKLDAFRFLIAPNPSNGKFTIYTNEDNKVIDLIEISTLLGKKIFVKKNISERPIHIDLSDFSKSFYLMKVFYKGNVYYEKILVE